MARFHTIVAAIDFSDTSTDALDAALDLAAGTSARVHVLHVVPDPFRQPWVVESAGVDLFAVQRTWMEEAEERLAQLTTHRAVDRTRVITTVAVGPASAEIVRYAADHAADVIVLGTHGHGLARRFLLGSVADRVIRQAGCPVMVVPHRTLRSTAEDPVAVASGAAL